MHILVPKSLAERLAEQKQRREQREQQRLNEQRRQEAIDTIVGELWNVPRIRDQALREEVKEVCRRLVNRGGGIVPADHPIEWRDVGHILSDVLLGPGVQYEIKT